MYWVSYLSWLIQWQTNFTKNILTNPANNFEKVLLSSVQHTCFKSLWSICLPIPNIQFWKLYCFHRMFKAFSFLLSTVGELRSYTFLFHSSETLQQSFCTRLISSLQLSFQQTQAGSFQLLVIQNIFLLIIPTNQRHIEMFFSAYCIPLTWKFSARSWSSTCFTSSLCYHHKVPIPSRPRHKCNLHIMPVCNHHGCDALATRHPLDT